MAARPLEPPRSLPASLHAVAAAVTGAAHPPRFTTGPATRHALAAAGALGATTGSVIHLAASPERVPASVLVHELTHARSPVRRPRFLHDGAGGHGGAEVDTDERAALTAGARAGMGSPVAAGLVGQLRVGGGAGPVVDVATRAAQAAVIAATASPLAGGWGAGIPGGGLTGGGLAGGATGGGLTGGAIGGWAETVGTGGAIGSGAPGAGDTGAGSSTNAGWAGGAIGPGAPATAAGAASAGAGAAAGAGAPGSAPLDVDAVVEAVEERLLREIERRGGRWAGVF